MSENRLLLIITHWKNEAYELFHQLEYIKNEYNHLQQKFNRSHYENNSRKILIHSPLIENEDLLKQLLRNVNPSSISDQLSVLCDFFVVSLKSLLLFEQKERLNTKFPPIIESIDANIKQIGNLIEKMNEDCSNQLIKL